MERCNAMIGMFSGVMSGAIVNLAISFFVEDGSLVQNCLIGVACLFGCLWITTAIEMPAQEIYRQGGMVNRCCARVVLIALVALFLIGAALLGLAITIFRNDDDAVTVSITSFTVATGLCMMVAPFASYFIERGRLSQARIASEKELESRKDAARKHHEDEWKKEARVGEGVELREDLYAWAFATCFHPDHVALQVFLGDREAESEKCEKALQDAREHLKVVQKIDFDANEQASTRRDETGKPERESVLEIALEGYRKENL